MSSQKKASLNIVFDLDKKEIPLLEFEQNVRFMDKKRNVIMEGEFSKIVYMDNHASFNGIYFVFSLRVKTVREDHLGGDKHNLWYSPYEADNQRVIQTIAKYEAALVRAYAQQMHCLKRPSNALRSQLASGNLKCYKLRDATQLRDTMSCVVKISGVWESVDGVGVTYKFLECL